MDELERLFDELVRYYRHSAVGRRCTGVVHNLNSPLQVLTLQCELLNRKFVEEKAWLAGHLSSELCSEWEKFYQYRDNKLRQFKAEVEELYQQARLIIRQGVHEDQREVLVLDLNDILQDELELFRAQPFFKHRVDKRFYFQEGLEPLYGFYIDFSQSFRNLVDNALEAMETVEMPVLTVETARDGRSRVIRVGDTGVGIAPEIQPKIFDPFFTTKDTPDGSRAGLGLYMAQRLLTPYGGKLQVKSRPGETWVTVTIP